MFSKVKLKSSGHNAATYIERKSGWRAVITATKLRAGQSGVRLLTVEGDFFTNVQTVSYLMGLGGSLPLRCGWGVRLAIHIYRVSRLRMSGAMPPLPLYVFVARIRRNLPVTISHDIAHRCLRIHRPCSLINLSTF